MHIFHTILLLFIHCKVLFYKILNILVLSKNALLYNRQRINIESESYYKIFNCWWIIELIDDAKC